MGAARTWDASAADSGVGVPPKAEEGRVTALPIYDVRVRRELAQRRLAVSLLRRTVRVLTLHGLDGAVVASAVLALAALDGASVAIRPLLPTVVMTFLLSLNATSAYGAGDDRRDWHRLLSAAFLASLLLAGLVAFPPHLDLSYAFIAALSVLAFAGLVAGRFLVEQGVRQVYARGIGLRRALLVGTLEEVSDALRQLRGDGHVDQYVVGHVTPPDSGDPTAFGTVAELESVLDAHDVQEVVVVSDLNGPGLRRVANACFARGIDVFARAHAAPTPDFFVEWARMGRCTMLRLHPPRLKMPGLVVKRAVDVLLSLVALIVLSPVILIIAAAIRLESPGPVIFRQTRVGLGGRLFTMWKFRSMAADAEARLAEIEHLDISGGSGPFKALDDPRITRVGRVLRRTSMDELPQLFNVICGEMSLVGPRPVPPSDLPRFKPRHFDRLTVVPGLTGPWQVNGRNLIRDFDTIHRMEREYIASWSLLLDLKIMYRTIGVVARGEGAY
jgi:exopolysaccharide biosynthesis polyprenyl glycosylphosphotransferase